MFRYLFYSVMFFLPIQVTADITLCHQFMTVNHLMTGSHGNAFECYQKILVTEPTHAEALAGLKEIERRYTRWAVLAVKQNKIKKAKKYIARLKLVNPHSKDLVSLEQTLDLNHLPLVSQDIVPSVPSSQDIVPPSQEIIPPSKDIEPIPVDDSPPQKQAVITHVGHIYETLNTTDCLIWSPVDIKNKAGKNAWGHFYPKKGDKGIVIDEFKHCHFDHTIYLLDIEGYYVLISQQGVQITHFLEN